MGRAGSARALCGARRVGSTGRDGVEEAGHVDAGADHHERPGAAPVPGRGALAHVRHHRPNGRPHLIELWYLPDGDQIVCWTYAKSQKVRNLERDPRATLQVEAGDSYGELRGVMLECDVDIERDPERVLDAGIALATHHSGQPDEQTRAGIAQQAPKRVVLRFTPTRIASWDHRKLG
jgi:PPOX class probable F420-dependent enzyme